jgi:DNA-directed RNA polymerase III subunit RPC1
LCYFVTIDNVNKDGLVSTRECRQTCRHAHEIVLIVVLADNITKTNNSQKMSDCTGHYGYIRLELPVFHIGYFKAIQNVLQAICKGCSRVLLPDDERGRYVRMMTSSKRDSISLGNLRKKILDRCKRVGACLRCGEVNGVVKKVPGAASLKLVHEKYKSKKFIKDEEKYGPFLDSFSTAHTYNPELNKLMSTVQESLNPQVVLKMFK